MMLPQLLCGSIFAQSSAHLNGYVTELESGECLIGAVVMVGNDWTVTNEYGYYSFTVATGENTIRCSYLGMQSDDIPVMIQKDTLVNISMTSAELIAGAVVEGSTEAVLPSAYMGVMAVPVSYVKEMPTLLGEPDLMKAIQKMPGIQSGQAGFSGVYVRGGGAEENLVLMDGVPVYNASHMLGLFSTFSPEAVKQVTVYKGFFPAKYGGRTSSVIDVRTNEGNAKRLMGTVSVGLINSRFHLEGPIITDKTSFSLSVRGTNTITLLPLTKILKSPYSLYFYDLTGKVTHRFSNSDRLYLSAYIGQDNFGYGKSDSSEFTYTDENDTERIGKKSSNEKYDLRWGNTIAAVRWNHGFGGNFFSDLAISWDHYRMKENTFQESLTIKDAPAGYSNKHGNHSAISDLNAVWDFELHLSTKQELSFGLSHTFHMYAPEKDYSKRVIDSGDTSDQSISYSSDKDVSYLGTESAVYFEDRLTTRYFRASIGLRGALYKTSGRAYPSIEPRLSVEYRPIEDISIKGSYSRMSQYVHLLASGMVSLPTDLWVPITKDIKPVISDHYSIGVFYSPVKNWKVSLEAYLKKEFNVLEYKDGQLVFTSATDWEEMVEMGNGSSKGIELYVQKTAGKVNGMLSYTLSKTNRVFPDGTINNGKPFPFTYDRRHVLDCFVRYSVNDNVRLNGSWSFSSGNMITASWRSTLIMGPDGEIEQAPYISGRNNYRLPASHRLDLSADFIKEKKHGERVWSFGIYNVYGAKNPDWVIKVSDLDVDSSGEVFLSHRLVKRTFLAFLPSISYTYSF